MQDTKRQDMTILELTSSSAIAEGPRDALSQMKSCQLLHNCTKNIAGMYFGLVTKHACYRRTDEQTDRITTPRPR